MTGALTGNETSHEAAPQSFAIPTPAPPKLPAAKPPVMNLRVNQNSKPAPGIYLATLITALATGFAFNLFLGVEPGVGFNLLCSVGIFFAGWFLIAREREIPLWRKLCASASLVYAAAVAFRASEILFLVNTGLMIGFATLACSPACSQRMKSVWNVLADAGLVAINALIGALMFAAETPWSNMRLKSQQGRNVARVLSGVVLALPFLVVFGLLFSRAELRFGEFFQRIFDAIVTAIFTNFWITFFGTIISLGLLRSSFIAKQSTTVTSNDTRRLGFVETTTVLTLLIVMFALFVLTQLPYLFGGQSQVTNTPDLAWSDYARRGFFELAWVATLLIPTLLLFLTCTRTETPKQDRLVKFLSAGLSALTAIIMVSAMQRMVMYTQNFGLTELRIYVSVCIVMLAIIIAMLNYLGFTARLHLFVPAALIIGFLFSLGIQVANVQATVARDIISRHQSGKNGDMIYLGQLSTDAVPAIHASNLPENTKEQITASILKRTRHNSGGYDWLSQPVSIRSALRFSRPGN